MTKTSLCHALHGKNSGGWADVWQTVS